MSARFVNLPADRLDTEIEDVQWSRQKVLAGETVIFSKKQIGRRIDTVDRKSGGQKSLIYFLGLP
jgi:hypothetical protein